MGNHPILGDLGCRLTSLVWDKDNNTITECWERKLIDKQKEKKKDEKAKKPILKQIQKKPMTKLAPPKKRPAKRAATESQKA